MKKLAVGVFALVLISCHSIRAPNGPFVANEPPVRVTVLGQIITSNPWPFLFLVPFSRVSCTGVSVEIANEGNAPISIDWDRSSIAFGDGSTSNVFISGQKFLTAGEKRPALSLAAGGKKRVDIYPSDAVAWTGKEWKIGGTRVNEGDMITLLIAYNDGKIVSVKYPAGVKTGFKFWL